MLEKNLKVIGNSLLWCGWVLVIACSSDGSGVDSGGHSFGPSVDDNVVAHLVHSVKLREDVL